MTKSSPEPVEILDRIEALIKPLNPPVMAFESHIKQTPFKILVSVLLSSRTKDAVTGRSVNRLFKVANSPEKMIILGEAKIAGLIYPVGFYRQKARNIISISKKLVEDRFFPQTREGLMAFPGVGRKTANLVLALAFNQPAVAVDTHVFRISRRLGWAVGRDPMGVEKELMGLFPTSQWSRINQVLVGFGQTICRPAKPLCSSCSVNNTCPFFRSKGKRKIDPTSFK